MSALKKKPRILAGSRKKRKEKKKKGRTTRATARVSSRAAHKSAVEKQRPRISTSRFKLSIVRGDPTDSRRGKFHFSQENTQDIYLDVRVSFTLLFSLRPPVQLIFIAKRCYSV